MDLDNKGGPNEATWASVLLCDCLPHQQFERQLAAFPPFGSRLGRAGSGRFSPFSGPGSEGFPLPRHGNSAAKSGIQMRVAPDHQLDLVELDLDRAQNQALFHECRRQQL